MLCHEGDGGPAGGRDLTSRAPGEGAAPVDDGASWSGDILFNDGNLVAAGGAPLTVTKVEDSAGASCRLTGDQTGLPEPPLVADAVADADSALLVVV